MIDTLWLDEYAPAAVDEVPSVPAPRDPAVCPNCLLELDRDLFCGTCGRQA